MRGTGERWDRMEGTTGHLHWKQGSSEKLRGTEMGQARKTWHTPSRTPPANIIMSDLEVNKKIPKDNGFRSVADTTVSWCLRSWCIEPTPTSTLAAVIPFWEPTQSVQGSQPLSPQSTRWSVNCWSTGSVFSMSVFLGPSLQ